ncbi:putative ABC transporter permease [Fulvivirga imtechensis AK7]|uniref:Putative ABC transporter permease n=1 Tax=Fulvivirga imtechensis AK7 TaxID=1237149 RepID=L8JR46_9BACT|nr:ABC transporter permease [Fulvivirga imtechensis]ELR69807.1 putative ABC transporter permease [Fulvivirga imtechensis AK7]
MELSTDQIDYIQKDINYRGIVYDQLEEELLDHICTLVEKKMEDGARFIDAYDQVIERFGSEQQIQHIQSQTLILSNNNTKIMLRNYFKIALRNLSRHKFYSFINVAGLAVGLACCLVITLFVMDELSYDDYHTKKDRIYRLTSHGAYGGNQYVFPVAPAPLAPALITDLPEVEKVVRFRSRGSYLVTTPQMTESYKEHKLIFADKDFFQVFSVPMLKGNPETALKDRMSLAISRSIAQKYFANEDPVGKTMILDGAQEYHVTAVYEDMPANGHLQFNFLMSMASLEESKNTEWLSNNFYTYVLLREGTSQSDFYQKMNAMAAGYIEPQLIAFIGKTMKEFEEGGNKIDFKVQPLNDIYLHSDFIFDIGPIGDISYIYMFSAIAIFILVIACINFMNLSTARSSNRAKEVGVRKVLGSFRSHLVRQFLTETILLCLIAFALAIALASIALPFFNELAGKNMALPVDSLTFYAIILGCALFIGILAGLYPAFFLSAFKPINVLKGKLALGTGSSFIRSGLVVFQFFISILLIIATATVYKQLNYIQSKKLGYDKEQVLLVNDAYMLGTKMAAFKEELSQLPNVANVSISGYMPVQGYNRSDMSFWEQGLEPTEDNMVNMQIWDVDEGYISTLGMEVVLGRNFNKDIASDSNAVILNEAAFKAYGFEEGKENFIQTFFYDYATGQTRPDKLITYRVIGVVKDFHFESMKENIGRLGMRLRPSVSTLAIRFSTSDIQTVISSTEDVWKKFTAELPFNYTFLDSDFGNMYRAEQRLASVFTIFAGLAILIGCLGLFALASFMAEQRTKEIGIRKVLGASVGKIVFMLSKEFSRLIIIAFIIAAPIAWWASSTWLDNYSYRVEIGVGLYLLAGMMAFLIAWLTVGYHSVKAAQANPVDSLRSE